MSNTRKVRPIKRGAVAAVVALGVTTGGLIGNVACKTPSCVELVTVPQKHSAYPLGSGIRDEARLTYLVRVSNFSTAASGALVQPVDSVADLFHFG